MTRLLPIVISTLCFVLAPAPASAHTEVPSPDPLPESVSRPPVEWARVRLTFMSGFPDVVGLHLALTAAHPFRLTAGAGYYVSGASTYLRMGYAFRLASGEDTAGHPSWTVDLTPNLGGRYYFGIGTREAWLYTLHAEVDITWWWSRHFGVTLDLNGGAGHMLVEQTVVPEFALSVGVAF